ncbi:MAG: hypothetical protein FJ382_00500 [Verrucomicrobia bacterium]|nr:hypothetical protein [Verrucomicrobiota bacterium]
MFTGKAVNGGKQLARQFVVEGIGLVAVLGIGCTLRLLFLGYGCLVCSDGVKANLRPPGTNPG